MRSTSSPLLVPGPPDGLAVRYAVSIVHLGDFPDAGTAIDLISGRTVGRVEEIVAVSAPRDVVAELPEYRVVDVFAVEFVAALPAFQTVIPGATGDPIVVGHTVHPVPSITTDQVVFSGVAACDASTGVQAVGTLAAREGVGSFLAVQPVFPAEPDYPVYASIAVSTVGVRTAIDNVAVLTAEEGVPAGRALDAISPSMAVADPASQAVSIDRPSTARRIDTKASRLKIRSRRTLLNRRRRGSWTR